MQRESWMTLVTKAVTMMKNVSDNEEADKSQITVT